MDIDKVKRTRKQDKKIVVSIRITQEQSKWMSDNEVSPTKLFTEALNELIETENGNRREIKGTNKKT